jgi:dihydroneopterin aldolase
MLHWSHPSPIAHKNVHEGLEYHKVCARWARLMRERTNRRLEGAISYIQRLATQDTNSWNPQ